MLQIMTHNTFKSAILLASLSFYAFVSPSSAEIYDYETDAELRDEDTGSAVSYEISTNYSHVFDGDIKQGNRDLGSISEDTYKAELVASIPLTYGAYLRLGVASEGFLFSGVGRAPISERLIDTHAIIGLDYELSDQWLLRVEAHPGIYSDFEDVSLNDVNVPMIIGATYLVDADLQWIFGMLVNPWGDIPVIPAAGVRWKFADAWTLNFILPKPKLEYEVDQSLTLFIHGELKTGTFRVGEDLGTDSGMPRINDSLVSYMEARVGAGLNYSITEWLSAEIDAGVVPYRNWDYFDDSLQIKNDSALNPYLQIGFKGTF